MTPRQMDRALAAELERTAAALGDLLALEQDTTVEERLEAARVARRQLQEAHRTLLIVGLADERDRLRHVLSVAA